jgi:hypothetical protein
MARPPELEKKPATTQEWVVEAMRQLDDESWKARERRIRGWMEMHLYTPPASEFHWKSF